MSHDEFALLRHFETDKKKVFAAFTDEAMFSKWFGPDSHPVMECALDPQPGGLLRIVMQSSDGTRYPVVGNFSIVDPHDHIAFTLATFPVPGGDYGFECSIAVTFSVNERRTIVDLRYKLLKARPEHLQAAAASREGWEKSLDRLRALLEGQ